MANSTARSSDFEYKVTQPSLPPGAKSPVMDYDQMTWWLNDMASRGWDLVSHAETRWRDGTIQSWWAFRRLREGAYRG